jgi:hypothetical protein
MSLTLHVAKRKRLKEDAEGKRDGLKRDLLYLEFMAH